MGGWLPAPDKKQLRGQEHVVRRALDRVNPPGSNLSVVRVGHK